MRVSATICALVLSLSWVSPALAINLGVPDASLKYKRYIKRVALNVWGLDAPVAMFAAQIEQESAWNPAARSWAGAYGLSQFMPRTEEWIKSAYAQQLGGGSSSNPHWSIRAMILYDLHLFRLNRDAVDDCEALAFSLAAYNGGQRWTEKRKGLSDTPGVCLGATCRINPGIKPSNQRENERYSERILLEREPKYIRAGWGAGACW